MRIAILSRYQNITKRGVESFVTELSDRLSKNHQVDVFAGKESDDFWMVFQGKYDIVMPLNGRWQAIKFSWGRFLGGYKLVIGGHSGIGRDDLINIVLGRPNIFVALTDLEYKWAKKWSWGLKVIKIPNGIDLGKFNPKGEKVKIDLPGQIILSVGALSWYKHHDKVIRAVSLLKNCSLLIVGEGEEKERLNKLAKELIPGRFKITKFDYQDMPKVYRSVNLFTLPSWHREAFGIVYLEALATNLPVVAPDDLSRKEIVGEGGILVDVSNSQKYADAIKQALETDWEERPRKQAEKFSWEKIVKEYEACFQNLLN